MQDGSTFPAEKWDRAIPFRTIRPVSFFAIIVMPLACGGDRWDEPLELLTKVIREGRTMV